MLNPVVHWEILGQDGQKLQNFYAQLFDWQIDANNAYQYGMVDTRSNEGINGGVARSEDGTNRVTVYVQVSDLRASLDKAERLGGKTIMPPTELPDVTFALFADPAGNVVGLVKG